MRRMFSVGLAAALALCVAGTASASTTIDIIFSSGTNQTTITPGFGTITAAVIMTTTDGLNSFSTTVFWDNTDTDAVSGTLEWNGFFGGAVFGPINPGPAGVFIDNSVPQVASFDGLSLTASILSFGGGGPYQLGTIVWLTTVAGITNITTGIIPGLDGFTLLSGGVINDSITFNGATINVVPEPATASLLGLGLVGLILAGRRKRA